MERDKSFLLEYVNLTWIALYAVVGEQNFQKSWNGVN